jgi:hypothetical protein
MTLTQRMIERVEYLKGEYTRLILADQADAIDKIQWRRMNTILCYLEERAAR